MNPSDTPRTDAAQFDFLGTIPTEFVRQLERDLNEAKKQAKELGFQVEEACLKLIEQHDKSVALTSDLDQWKQMAGELLDTLKAHSNCPYCLEKEQCIRCGWIKETLTKFNELNKKG
jgi:hypothetical protein